MFEEMAGKDPNISSIERTMVFTELAQGEEGPDEQ
jgi:hypothetical protein